MPRVVWPLLHGQPMVKVVLTQAADGQQVSRQLLGDTGAGTEQDNLKIFLTEADCLLCGGSSVPPVLVGGAYTGTFPVYILRVQVPALDFNSSSSWQCRPAPRDWTGL
jgi:hypothetical protein